MLTAAMEPALDERDDGLRVYPEYRRPVCAAMEPALDERDDGSRISRAVTCGNAQVCEHLSWTYRRFGLYGRVKGQKQALTCVRAPQRQPVTTFALADAGCDHQMMTAS